MDDQHRRLTQDMEAAEAARKLLEDPALIAAFEKLEAAYLGDWRATAPAQQAEREDAYLMLRALDKLRTHLATVVEGGSLAEHNMRAAFRRGAKH